MTSGRLRINFMSKMSRHAIRKKLVKIEQENFRLANEATNQSAGNIYRDIAYLSKIILILEKQGPTIGKDVEFDV